ncbi:hypothetical protein DAMDJJ_18540 [Cupriavidus necator]
MCTNACQKAPGTLTGPPRAILVVQEHRGDSLRSQRRGHGQPFIGRFVIACFQLATDSQVSGFLRCHEERPRALAKGSHTTLHRWTRLTTWRAKPIGFSVICRLGRSRRSEYTPGRWTLCPVGTEPLVAQTVNSAYWKKPPRRGRAPLAALSHTPMLRQSEEPGITGLRFLGNQCPNTEFCRGSAAGLLSDSCRPEAAIRRVLAQWLVSGPPPDLELDVTSAAALSA